MKISKARLSVIGIVFALVFAAIGAGTALAVEGNMQSAKTHLEAALTSLNASKPDKAGHRSQAIQLTNQAITQVNEGITAGAK